MSDKLKNKGLWVSLFSVLGLFLQSFGLYEKLGITDGDYQTLVSIALTVLGALGVISNPSSGTWYKDTTQVSSSDNS